ncbi:ABC transporter domain-containing protein [Aphelenchoides besseyi]|nr:ABC transporter domain-containing protein [Aphelenchoides besseyi]
MSVTSSRPSKATAPTSKASKAPSQSASQKPTGSREQAELIPSSLSPTEYDETSGIHSVYVTWDDVAVKSRKTNVPILKSVSGIARPGQTLALMGASGAGKTTLLNFLMQRNMKGLKMSGQILYNGNTLTNGRGLPRISAYVQQEDLFVGNLTVREHLSIQASLKVPKANRKERQERVNSLIRDLKLEQCSHGRIGVSGVRKGISGGEAKRLALASELLSHPSILFCDEPTTGLDSYLASELVGLLDELAQKNMTIICTIHSPSSEIFCKFDQVMFLAEGRVAYWGTPEQCYNFFGGAVGSDLLILPNRNLAHMVIEGLAIHPERVEQSRLKVGRICDKFAEWQKQQPPIDLEDAAEARKLRPLIGCRNVPLHRLFFAIFRRTLLDIMRNPSLARAKFFQKVFMGVFLGLLYLNSKLDQDGIISRKGALFYYISELTYATIFGIQTFLPQHFPLMAREYHDGLYPVSIYYIATILAYLPLFTLDGIVMVTISYWMIGLHNTATSFFTTLLTTILVEWSAVSVGIMVSAAAPSYAFAVSISGPLLTMFSLTGGLYTNVAKMPVWIRWIQYLSWFRFGYEALIVNEWQHYPSITCEPKHSGAICEDSGDDVIRNLNFEKHNLYFNEICMFFYIIGAYIIGYVGLVVRVLWAR